MQTSGNCYKVRLTARQLAIPIALKEYRLNGGQTQQSDFLAKNPNALLPILEFEDGRILPESDAIIWYLAEGTPLIPESKWDRAQVLSWMFFEQYSHEPYIAVARYWMSLAPKEEFAKKQHLVPEWHAKGNAALKVMNMHLRTHDWFGGPKYSIADIALYSYTYCAADAEFDLAEYPAVTKWVARVAAEPGHITQDEFW